MPSVTSNIDFQNAGVWTGLAPDQLSLSASGMTLSAVGGTLSQYLGASVMSPSDNANPQGWTLEVDAYNDTPEGLNLHFDQAQTSVTVTLYQMYKEYLFNSKGPDAELADFTVHFSDGSTATTTLAAIATTKPGEVAITFNSSDFGGRTIVGVDVAPNLANPTVLPAVAPYVVNDYNAHHPYSEFTLKSVSFSHDNAPVQITLSEDGAVTEILGTPAPGAVLADTGLINFTDADAADAHTVSAVALGVNQGTLTASLATDSTGGATGQVSWTYNVDATKFEYLAAGQTVVEKFQVTIDDGNGSQVTQEVDVTVTGTNDAPLINLPGSVVTGAVTELGATSGSAAVDTANGAVAFTDVDLADAHSASVAAIGSTLGSLTLGPVSEAAGAGSLGWTYSVADKALDYLAAGETRVESFNVTVDDGHGGTAQQQVDVTLTGSNDGPLINLPGSVVTGAVSELGNTANSAVLDKATGSIAFTDLDLSDTHSASATAIGSTIGTLTLGAVTEGPGAGNLGWTYSVADKALDYLAAGQTRVESFNVTVDDGHGGTAQQQVDITLTGSNDGPLINLPSSVVTGAVSELANTANSAALDKASGSVAFTDLDLSDTHTASSAAIGSVLGSLTLGAVSEGPGAGSVAWNYSVADKALDYLAAGQTRVDSFNVTVDDGHGGTAQQQVNVTLTGSNDGPLINLPSSVVTGAITELANTKGSATVDKATGSIAFTDLDLTDTHTASAAAIGSTLGTLTLGSVSEGPGAGSLGWTYSVADKALDYLAAGQTRVESFNVTVDDKHGGTAVQKVDITLTGTNDGPVVNLPGSVVNGSVNERANVSNSPLNDTTTGSIAFTDLDLTDKHTITTSAIGTVLGSLTLGSVSESGGAGSVGWTYTVADKSLDFLGVGQTRVEQFNVTIDDGNGGVVTQVVNVTLNGANDPPVVNLASSTVTGTVTERANLYNSSLADTASGSIAFTDIDKSDTHTRSVAAVGTTLGTLTLGSVVESNGAGTIAWNYSVADKKLDYLGAGQTRNEVFNVTIDDGHGGTTVQAVTVTLKGVNDGPTAVCDTVCVNDHDSTGNIYNTVLANDTDPDLNDTKTIVSVNTSHTDGLVLFNSSSHTLVYVAAAEEYVNLVKGTASDSFTYTMSDSAGATSTATVDVQIKGVANTDVGGSCNDRITACGPAVIDGKGGNDTLTGSNYDDVLKGGEGCDTLSGGRGSDVLYGGNGDDLIYGGDGDDIILGGDGNNILSGGSGSDYFVMSAVSAKDTILDFEVGKDHLYFADGITVTSVKAATVISTASTVLNLSDGGQVMLVGIKNVTDWHSLL